MRWTIAKRRSITPCNSRATWKPELADKFIGMYVNKWTLGYGERGRQAVHEFLKRGVDAGLIPGPPDAEFLLEE